MSKSNVHPSHYTQAGRERQGEDIAQAWNKQRRAVSEVRRRAESSPVFQPPAPVAEAESAAPESTETAQQPPARKAAAKRPAKRPVARRAATARTAAKPAARKRASAKPAAKKRAPARRATKRRSR